MASDAGTSLCTGPRCTNSDPSCFEERTISSDTECYVLIICKLCGEEHSLELWKHLTTPVLPMTEIPKPGIGTASPEGIGDISNLLEDHLMLEDIFGISDGVDNSIGDSQFEWSDNEKHMQKATENLKCPTVSVQQTDTVRNHQRFSQLASSAETVMSAEPAETLVEPALVPLYSAHKTHTQSLSETNNTQRSHFTRSRSLCEIPAHSSSTYHMTQTYSCEGLSDLFSSAACVGCRQPKAPVFSPLRATRPRGVTPETPTVWYCQRCDDISGFDDSFSLDEVHVIADLLVDSLEHAALGYDCPSHCGNSNPYLFVFEQLNGSAALKCLQCDAVHELVGQDENAQDAEQNIRDAPHTMDADPPLQEDDIQLQCDCGNQDLNTFGFYYNRHCELVKMQCYWCYREMIADPRHAKDKDLVIGTVHGPTDFHPPVGRTKIKNVADFRPADHIAWHQKLAYWHHAIVVSVGKISGKVKVIHYNGPAKEYGGKGVICEEWLDINFSKEDVYRMEYTRCLPPDVTLTKARQRLGETSYNLKNNNCEHFAQWCKTGVSRSGQVKDVKQTALEIKDKLLALAGRHPIKGGIKIIRMMTRASSDKTFTAGARVEGRGGVTLQVTSGSSKPLASATTSVAKAETKAAASSVLTKVDYAFMGLVVAVEGIRTARDVLKHKKKRDTGEISQDEYLRFKVKRISQGVGGAGGTIIGSVAGQFIIPIPVLGGVIGSTLGAFIGEAVGAVAGRHISKTVH